METRFKIDELKRATRRRPRDPSKLLAHWRLQHELRKLQWLAYQDPTFDEPENRTVFFSEPTWFATF